MIIPQWLSPNGLSTMSSTADRGSFTSIVEWSPRLFLTGSSEACDDGQSGLRVVSVLPRTDVLAQFGGS